MIIFILVLLLWCINYKYVKSIGQIHTINRYSKLYNQGLYKDEQMYDVITKYCAKTESQLQRAEAHQNCLLFNSMLVKEKGLLFEELANINRKITSLMIKE